MLDGEAESEPIRHYRSEFATDVREDRDTLRAIEDLLAGLDAEDDPKLRLLTRLLEASPSRKIVVFSTFTDTIRCLADHLPCVVADRERIEVIGAETSPDERTALLARFCPWTVVRRGYEPPEGEVDLLLCNDVLSEGQNLQQAAGVISYDMPWNPQRVVQRYGRVIRLKSPHREVHLTTMLPEPGDLEAILRLEVTILRKVVAAAPYGMEVRVIDSLDAARGDVDTGVRSYAQRLAEGDATLLDEQDDAGYGDGLVAEALRAELGRRGRRRTRPPARLAVGHRRRVSARPWSSVPGTCRHLPVVPGARRVPPALEVHECGRRPVGACCQPSANRSRRGARYRRPVDRSGDGVGSGGGINRRGAQQRSGQNARRVDRSGSEEGSRRTRRPPPVGQPDGSEEAWDVLQVGRSQPERKALGEVRRQLERGEISATEAAVGIVAVTRDYGLRRVVPVPEKEPIKAADVGVVCWMAVL